MQIHVVKRFVCIVVHFLHFVFYYYCVEHFISLIGNIDPFNFLARSNVYVYTQQYNKSFIMSTIEFFKKFNFIVNSLNWKRERFTVYKETHKRLSEVFKGTINNFMLRWCQCNKVERDNLHECLPYTLNSILLGLNYSFVINVDIVREAFHKKKVETLKIAVN